MQTSAVKHYSEKTMRIAIGAALAFLVLLTGCSKEAAKTADKGLFHITLSSQGELLKNGRNEVVVRVTDNRDQAVEHAEIDIVPWMPEHNHGAMWPPATIEQGKGLYRSVIALTMSGHWELKVTVRKADISDSTTFDFPDVKD
jgi:hypothetical protein